MKLSIYLLLVTSFSLSAKGFSQNDIISLEVKDAKISKIINEIRKVSDYRFLYRVEEVDKYEKRDFKADKLELREVMVKLLQGTNLTYTLNTGIIIIKPDKKKDKKDDKKENIIKGKIVDEKGKPLPGASIIVKGTSVGVVSQTDGTFEIKFDKDIKKQILQISFIGFKNQELKLEDIKNKKDLVITLVSDKKELEEVVVTGYANINKKSFTGNAVSVSKEDIIKAAPQNVVQALQLFDPSLRMVVNNEMGSNPNALPEFYIRGRSGIGTTELDKINETNLKNNPNLPTFILDGFEVSVEKIYDLDVNRIKSLTILKDAAATAIYGSRAANGVIVIERVQPKSGEVRVSYNLNMEVTTPDLSDYNLFNAREKLEAETLAGLYSSEDEYTKRKEETEYNEKYAKIAKGVDTDWLAVPTQTELNQTHSLFIEGGHRDLLFGLDLKVNKKDGVMKGSQRDNASMGFSITYRTKSLLFRNYMSYDKVNTEDSPYGDFSKYTSLNPYVSYKDIDGNYVDKLKTWDNSFGITNPLLYSKLHSYNKSEIKTFTDNFSVDWFMNDNLRFKNSISVTEYFQENKIFNDPTSPDFEDSSHDGLMQKGRKNISENKEQSWDFTSLLIYNKKINNHNFNFSLGLNITQRKSQGNSFSFRGFPTGLMDDISFAYEIENDYSGLSKKSRLFGSFLTSNYTYKDIYLFDLSGRLDGSSKFGTEKKYAPFWSGGVGMNIHKYEFMRKLSWINLLKVRASYGQTGKTNFPVNAAQTIYNYNVNRWYISGLGATLSAFGNDKLMWEKTNTTDYGIETSLFSNKIYLKFSAYTKLTKDLISDVTLAASTGFRNYKGNTGELENKGWEFNIITNILNSESTSLNLYFNAVHNENSIVKIAQELKDYNRRVNEYYEKENKYEDKFNSPLLKYYEGASTTSIYAMQSLGINPADGREVYVKKNGELTYDWEAGENVVCGDQEPDVSGSFGFNFRHKQFSLYTGFLYEYGGQIYNYTLVNKVEDANIKTNCDKRVLTERWHNPGDITVLKDIKRWGEMTMPSSRFVQDNNFMKLQSLTLSYNFKDNICKKLGMSMLKLQLNATDLFIISSIKQERGTSYPFAKSYFLTLNAKF